MAKLVRRVSMEGENLSVSFPGFDAKNASFSKKAFDSRFAFVGRAIDGQVRVTSQAKKPGGTRFIFSPQFEENSPPYLLCKWSFSPGSSEVFVPRVDRLSVTPLFERIFRGIVAEVTGGSVKFYSYTSPTNWLKIANVKFKALI